MMDVKKTVLDRDVLPQNRATHHIKIQSKLVLEGSLREIESDFPVQFLYSLKNKKLTISYDASKISFSQIINYLELKEITPLKNWWFRVKAYFYDFTDENIETQAHAKPKSCCNKLPHS
jgi:hypothetical protein